MKTIVATKEAPGAIGPYSQAVEAGGLLFLSGQLGIDPATGALRANAADQARRALDNLAAILRARGLDMRAVVKTTIFLADMGDFAAVNEVYAACFGAGDYPARSCVQAAGLPRGARVEIEAIASLS
nr:RidA family protein [Maliibacterium massiliense]